MSQISGKFILNATVALAKLSQSGATTGDLIYWGGSQWVSGHPSLIIETYTATTSLTNNEQDVVIMNSASAVNLTLNFPASARKKPLIVKNIGVGGVTVLPYSGDSIDSAASVILQNKGAAMLIPSVTDWWLLNSGASSSFQIDGGNASSSYGGTATIDAGGA